jgi:hypothetical protein
MKWAVAVFAALFIYAGYRNLRNGDEAPDGRSLRRLPVPRRLLGVIQLLLGFALGGVGISLFGSNG